MISSALQYFITFVRNDIKKRVERENYVEMETSVNARIRLICLIHEWFPDTKKNRDLRLNIIMALTGMPIISQNDLPAAYTAALIEAFNDGFAKDSTRQLSRELAKNITEPHFVFPWKILRPGTDVDMPSMWDENDEDGENGSSRGIDQSRTGTEE